VSARDNVRRSVVCACGSNWYEKTVADGGPEIVRVWRCGNCGAETPRRRLHRATNHHRAVLAAIRIRALWAPTDEALRKLVEAGTIKSGALLVHASCFDHHLARLVDIDRPTNFEVRYHAERAQYALEAAEAFVAAQGAVVEVTQ
jgi:hypothetical protein